MKVYVSSTLHVQEAIDLPADVSSLTPIISRADVLLVKEQNSLPHGGITILKACGSTTYLIA